MKELNIAPLMKLLKAHLQFSVTEEEVKSLLETHGTIAGRMNVRVESDYRLDQYVVIEGMFGWARTLISRDEDIRTVLREARRTTAEIYRTTCELWISRLAPNPPVFPGSLPRRHLTPVVPMKKEPDLSKLMVLLKTHLEISAPEEEVRDLIENGGRSAGLLLTYVKKRPACQVTMPMTFVFLEGVFGWRSWAVTSADDISERLREAEGIAKIIAEALDAALSDDLVRRANMAISAFDHEYRQRPAYIRRSIDSIRPPIERQRDRTVNQDDFPGKRLDAAMDKNKFNEACAELGLSQKGCVDTAELFSIYGMPPVIELLCMDNYRRQRGWDYPVAFSVSLTKPGSDNPVSIRAEPAVIKNTPNYWEKVLNLVTTFILTKEN